jgi:NADP-dependent 3-hydroxy acid dehydrogenase YdfG
MEPGFVSARLIRAWPKPSFQSFASKEMRSAPGKFGMIPLTPEDIAETLVWVASRPPHVNIDELLIKPTDQASMQKIYRREP